MDKGKQQPIVRRAAQRMMPKALRRRMIRAECLKKSGVKESSTPELVTFYDFPYLTENDIKACLAYAADSDRRLASGQQWIHDHFKGF